MPTEPPTPTKPPAPPTPTEPIASTAPPEPAEPTEPEPSRGPVARRVRAGLPGGAIAVAGISAGAAAVLLASGALIAMSSGSDEVNEELASLKEELSRLSARIDDEQTARVEELKKALAETEQARDAAVDALDGVARFSPTPELVLAVRELEQMAKLPSVPEKAKRLLEAARERYEKEQKQLASEHDKLRKQRYYDRTKEVSRQRKARSDLQRTFAKWQRMLEEATLRAVLEIYKMAREAELKHQWAEALSHYQNVASINIRSAARYAAASRARVVSIRRRIEAGAAAGRAKALKARKIRGRGKGQPVGPPVGPADGGVEVF